MAREVIWPRALRVSSFNAGLVGNAGEAVSPLTGKAQTLDRSGDRWRFTLTVEDASNNASVAEQAIAEAFIASIRNKNARVWVPVPGALRGSFPASELFTNADFSNGATGWNVQEGTLTVADRVLRLTANRVSGAAPAISQAPAATQYAPLVMRGFLGARNRKGLTLGTYAGGADYSTDAQGLLKKSIFPLTTNAGAAYPAVYDGDGTVTVTGDWLECNFASLSRCALVDNGPNALPYSDQLGNAAWAKAHLTVSENAATAPDGTATADVLVEDNANAQHYIGQQGTRATAAEAIVGYGFFRRGTGARDLRLVVGNASLTDYAQAYFDLGTGAVASVGTNGAGATNARAFSVPIGAGWWFCALVANVQSSADIYLYAEMTSGGVGGNAGDASSSIVAWRLGAARSSVPTIGAQTTASALAGGAAQPGAILNIKGLPVSTQNLACAGDWCQIGNQFFKLIAPLDSDAAGRGQLSISPNIRTPFADNEPVIFNRPMARMRLVGDVMSWSARPGTSSYQFTFEEALDG